MSLLNPSSHGGFSTNLRSVFLATAILTSSVAASAQTNAPEAEANTPVAAMNLLRPIELAISASNKIADPAQKTAEYKKAWDALCDAQKKIKTLYGEGAESAFVFVHAGKTYTVYINCDDALLRLTSKGFAIVPTQALVEPIHLAVMTGMTYFDPEQEKKEKAFAYSASNLVMPLFDRMSDGYRHHIFAPDKAKGEKHLSTHNIDPALIDRVLAEICEPRTRALNERLKADLVAKPSMPAPTTAPATPQTFVP